MYKAQSKDTFNLFVNLFMKQGKKLKARKFFFDSIFLLKKKTKKDPWLLLEKALHNARPLVKLKRKKIKGRMDSIPTIFHKNSSRRLGAKWIVQIARLNSKKLKSFSEAFCNVIIETSQKKGSVIKYKETFHLKVLEKKSLLRFWGDGNNSKNKGDEDDETSVIEDF